MSTITAISTPPGAGGVAVIRLSGPDAFAIADMVWRGASVADSKSHSVHLGRIIDSDGSVLDHAVATIFRAPNSFTGEDTVEFTVHGSPWIQRKLVQLLCSLGAEPAGRGEFTRRAFVNGRLDLAQAEAVADVIASSSRAAHRLAVTQMSGEFSSRLEGLRERLVKLASLLELELDFSEEEVEFADRSQLIQLTDDAIAYIERLTSTYEAGRAIKDGVSVAIAGAPNAGKSTLLNKLLDEDKAIVSDIPGTTRDIIEDTREIGGILFRFFDTAGLRDTDDVVESIGIDRAQRAIDRAQIVLWLLDGADPHKADRLNEIEGQIARRHGATHLVLLTKTDLCAKNEGRTAKSEAERSETGDGENGCEESKTGIEVKEPVKLIEISAKTGVGMESLEKELAEVARGGIDTQSEVIITNARHQAALTAGADSLRRAQGGIVSGLSADFIAQDIREALHHVGLVTGRITTPDLLSSIFSTFCIGK